MTAQRAIADSEVDVQELLDRVEGDLELLHEIFSLFLEEFPKSYTLLTSALASNDLEQVQVTAHTLKGMLASLSFVRASTSARRIEQMARQSQREGIAEEITALGVIAQAAQASLQKTCSEASW